MATITQTVEEFMPATLTKQITLSKPMELPSNLNLPPTKMNLRSETKQELPPQVLGCPPDCECKKTKTYQSMQLFFNALGILVALLATYLIVTTDSNLYLVFWVVYSVLRRLNKKRAHVKND